MLICVLKINNQWCFMDAIFFMNEVTKDGEGFPLFIVDYGVDISENKVGSGGGGARSG